MRPEAGGVFMDLYFNAGIHAIVSVIKFLVKEMLIALSLGNNTRPNFFYGKIVAILPQCLSRC